jgi:hypothetical protein
MKLQEIKSEIIDSNILKPLLEKEYIKRIFVELIEECDVDEYPEPTDFITLEMDMVIDVYESELRSCQEFYTSTAYVEDEIENPLKKLLLSHGFKLDINEFYVDYEYMTITYKIECSISRIKI